MAAEAVSLLDLSKLEGTLTNEREVSTTTVDASPGDQYVVARRTMEHTTFYWDPAYNQEAQRRCGHAYTCNFNFNR